MARKLLLLELPVRVRLMGVRVSKFQGAADPISRSQPFISTFLRDAPDELTSDATAASDSNFSAETVATPNVTDLNSNDRLGGSNEDDCSDDSYRGRSVSAADTLETEAASSGPTIAPANASHSAATLHIPGSRHSRDEGLQVDRLDPKQSSSAHRDRDSKRKRSPEPDSDTPTSSDTRSPQGWVCSVCTFRNTSSRGGVLLPWCAMCPDGRRFPTVSKRARAVEHVGLEGRTSSRNGTHSSSVRRQVSRPISSFFAVDHQPPAQKPSSDCRVSSDDMIDKFVDITKASRGDAIKRLALAGNDIEAAIDIYFRNN